MTVIHNQIFQNLSTESFQTLGETITPSEGILLSCLTRERKRIQFNFLLAELNYSVPPLRNIEETMGDISMEKE